MPGSAVQQQHAPLGPYVRFFVGALSALIGGTIRPASAQIPYPIPPPPPPIFNPSTPLRGTQHEADARRPWTAKYPPG